LLLERYKELSANSNTFSLYTEAGNGKLGCMYYSFNSNYRYIKSYLKNYETFKAADGVDRNEWEMNPEHGQEMLKQHTVKMLQSKLFSKNERVYYQTRKGETLGSIPIDYTENEKWILIFLILLDAYFEDIPNYFLERTQYVLENLIASSNGSLDITKETMKFIKECSDKPTIDMFSQDYIYIDTFFQPYDSQDFLSLYLNSNENEKQKLHEYVRSNYETKARNCILSKKFKASGVYDRGMVIDNAKVLFLMEYFLQNMKFDGYEDYTHKIIECYKQIELIDEDRVLHFIEENREVYQMIYYNLFEQDMLEIDETVYEDEGIIPIEKIDNTTTATITKFKQINSILKRKAMERANYKCELEILCNCASHYFTSKKTGQNYLEIHHLIPREFSNEFENSIETVENYVSLCPRCHRLLHQANDRERTMALNSLFAQRGELLKARGITVDNRTIKKYYGIEE